MSLDPEYNRRYYLLNKDKWERYMQRPGERERRALRSRERFAERKSAISSWKLEHGCMDCGYDKIPEALEFDHTSDDKLGNIANLCQGALETAIAEMEKCDVVCANCHRERTIARLGA
jgi:hypothetical protein